MSYTIAIHIDYAQPMSPMEIFKFLLENGWKCGYGDDYVMFAFLSNYEDGPDWTSKKAEDFSVGEFMQSHGPNDVVIIDMRKGDLFGSVLIYEEYMSIILGDVLELEVDSVYYRRVPDFSRYLKELVFLLDFTGSRQYDCSVRP